MKTYNTMLNINAVSFDIDDIDSHSFTLTDADGSKYIIATYGDKSFLDLMATGLNPYKNRARELIEKVRPYVSNRNQYTRKPIAIYLGKQERKALRVYANISRNDWDMVLGIEVIPVDKDTYFDLKF